MTKSEEILSGGRMTEGVVRVGDTVRRPRQASSPFIEKLFVHLHQQNLDITPKYKGIDEEGRDIFSYLEGDVPSKFRYFTDAQVVRAAQIIRAFHDGTRRSKLAGDSLVVCHHDAGPNNFVFKDDMPYALIDFDLASPGDPMEDIGYMAWLWCISSKPERPPVEAQAAQVRLLVDGYGLDESARPQVFEAIIERQHWNVDFWRHHLSRPELGVATPDQIAARIEWTKQEMAYVMKNQAVFMAALME